MEQKGRIPAPRLDLQIQEQFTLSFSLDFGNLDDVIVDGRAGRFRFLIDGQLDSCCGYRCWHWINRHDDLPLLQLVSRAFTSCKELRLTATGGRCGIPHPNTLP